MTCLTVNIISRHERLSDTKMCIVLIRYSLNHLTLHRSDLAVSHAV